MREAHLFIVALLAFILGSLFWQVGVLIGLLLLIIGIVLLVRYLQFVLNPQKAGISKWPPLSREDRRAARSKLSKYKLRS